VLDRHTRFGKSDFKTGDWKPLLHHMLDVAAVMAAGLERRPELLAFIASRLGMKADDTRAMLTVLAALHDAGKTATVFQALNPTAAAELGIPTNLTRKYQGHDSLGWAMLLKLARDRRLALPVRTDPTGRLLLGIVCGHHGTPPRGRWEERIIPAMTPMSLEITDDDLDALVAHVDIVNGLFGWNSGLPDPDGLKTLSFFLNGLVTLCDWVGSSDRFLFADRSLDAESYWRDHTLVHAARALDDFHPAPFSNPARRAPASFARLFPGIAEATPLQAKVDELFTAERLPPGPLLVFIEDMTGAGKTEAGDLIAQRLVALGRADGVYVGLPTMATADAAFARRFPNDGTERAPLDEALFSEPAQVMLAHSKRLRGRNFRTAPTFADVENEGAHVVEWLARSSRLALTADLGVGTVDQALAGAVAARFSTLRLAGLWRKVLVIDEVHAYDDHMRVFLAGLLRHHAMMGDPAVLMSATLPGDIRLELTRAYAEGAGWTAPVEVERNAYPLLTLVHAGGVEAVPVDAAPGPGQRPVRFEAVHTIEEAERRVTEWSRAGRSVVWFRNTVGEAVETWRRLRADFPALGLPEPLLYHARFVPRDRAAAEARLLEVAGKHASADARRGRVVISTQAAEQSLDLDFDELVSDIAPADVLFQRLGRRRRHPRDERGALLGADAGDGRPESPVLLHVSPLDPDDRNWRGGLSWGAARIYDNPGILWHTATELLGRTTVVPALDVRSIIETVFSTPAPSILAPATNRANGDDLAEAQRARSVALDFTKDLLSAVRDRVGDDEEGTPKTRLGESFSVVLAVVEGGVASFLVDDDDPLSSSECRLPRRIEPSNENAALLERLSPGARRMAKNKVFVLLSDAGDGRLRGTAMSREGETILEYSREEGLTVTSAQAITRSRYRP